MRYVYLYNIYLSHDICLHFTNVGFLVDKNGHESRACTAGEHQVRAGEWVIQLKLIIIGFDPSPCV